MLMTAPPIFRASKNHPTISLRLERVCPLHRQQQMLKDSRGWIDRQRLTTPGFLEHAEQVQRFVSAINDPFRVFRVEKSFRRGISEGGGGSRLVQGRRGKGGC